jgi:hypothetical protein
MVTVSFMCLQALASLIPLIHLFKYSKGGIPAELLPLLFFLVIQFVLNTLGDVFAFYSITFHSLNSNFIYHVDLPLSLIAQLLFFKALDKKIYYTHPLFMGGIVLTVLIIMNSFLYEKVDTFNGTSYALKCIYVLYVCLRYYWFKINPDDVSDILQQPSFWFISGFFIYYCSCFVIFAAYNSLVVQDELLTTLSARYQTIMYLIMCILLAKGIKQKAYA